MPQFPLVAFLLILGMENVFQWMHSVAILDFAPHCYLIQNAGEKSEMQTGSHFHFALINWLSWIFTTFTWFEDIFCFVLWILSHPVLCIFRYQKRFEPWLLCLWKYKS